MHLGVDHAGQNPLTGHIQHIHLPVFGSQIFVDARNALSFYQDIALKYAALVDHSGILYQCRHGLVNQLEIFNAITPKTASRIMPRLILLWPAVRSVKMTGTSTIVNPFRHARNFISI